jgi:hypothetical protein
MDDQPAAVGELPACCETILSRAKKEGDRHMDVAELSRKRYKLGRLRTYQCFVLARQILSI